MTDCEDCDRLRDYLQSRSNREATTSEIEDGLGWSRHRIVTHRRHLAQGHELVLGRLLRRPDRTLFTERKKGRKHWHHLLSPAEDRELGAQGLREILDELLFILQTVPPRGSSLGGKATSADTSRLPLDDGLPFAREGAESLGDYSGRLSGIRLEVETKADGTIQRKLVQVLGSDAAKVD